jgi:hypothetical protein
MTGLVIKAASAVILLAFLGVWSAVRSDVRFKPYSSGVPDYENTVVLQAEPARSHLELRAAVRRAVTTTALCVRGQVNATVVEPHIFRTNICDVSSYTAIKRLLGQLAPSLDPTFARWTWMRTVIQSFWSNTSISLVTTE